jgi:hypothetical protein
MTDETRDRGEKMILGGEREEEALEILGTRNAKTLKKTGTREWMTGRPKVEMKEKDKMKELKNKQMETKDLVIALKGNAK